MWLKSGKTTVHPLSGERLTFLETAATTGGDLLKISVDMAPGGTVGRPHLHPKAEEEFKVLSGRIQNKSSGKTRVADAGESVIVPSGADHIWGNPFDDPATITVAIHPALKLETFFETVFGLASDGRLNPKTKCLASCKWSCYCMSIAKTSPCRESQGWPPAGWVQS
jgi:quercetin dioxygenase-like cupin family protein